MTGTGHKRAETSAEWYDKKFYHEMTDFYKSPVRKHREIKPVLKTKGKVDSRNPQLHLDLGLVLNQRSGVKWKS